MIFLKFYRRCYCCRPGEGTDGPRAGIVSSIQKDPPPMFVYDLFDAAILGIGDVLAIAGGLSGYEGQPGNQGGN